MRYGSAAGSTERRNATEWTRKQVGETFVMVRPMASSGESGAPERWGSVNAAEVQAEALDVLSDALQWQLADARWQVIEQILNAMDAALETGDTEALAVATADLELAGPLRILPIGPPPVGPTPKARDLLNKMVYSLGGTMAGEDQGDAAGGGAVNADDSRN
jgi:hypothetical protein